MNYTLEITRTDLKNPTVQLTQLHTQPYVNTPPCRVNREHMRFDFLYFVRKALNSIFFSEFNLKSKFPNTIFSIKLQVACLEVLPWEHFLQRP